MSDDDYGDELEIDRLYWVGRLKCSISVLAILLLFPAGLTLVYFHWWLALIFVSWGFTTSVGYIFLWTTGRNPDNDRAPGNVSEIIESESKAKAAEHQKP